MPSTVPTPIAAALGLVPTVLGGVRRLPSRAVQLPVLAVSSALSGVVAARREYDDLAERGERLIARLRGTSFDEVEDSVEDLLAATPLARPYDRVEDALEDVTEAVTTTLKRSSRSAGKGLDKAADVVEDAAEAVGGQAGKATKAAANGAGTAAQAATAVAGQAQDAAGTAAETAGTAADAAQEQVPADHQKKGRPTPKATEPDMTRIDTAATPDVTQTVEDVAAGVGGPVLSHDELPLPDYDHMTLGSLRGRMRSLTIEQLVQVRDYEKAHADRLPVITMLDNRIAKLASDADAPQPSGTPPTSPTPEQRTAAGGKGSLVSPETSGPAMNPPSQGVPTNPAQPRSTG
jgi:hypothetical protein